MVIVHQKAYTQAYFGLSTPTPPLSTPQKYDGDSPNAWIGLVPRRRVGERGDVFVNERPEPQAEVAGELPHLLGELGAQVSDAVQVILHGQGEIHQVVQVHGVVFHLAHLQLEGCLVTWGNRETM